MRLETNRAEIVNVCGWCLFVCGLAITAAQLFEQGLSFHGLRVASQEGAIFLVMAGWALSGAQHLKRIAVLEKENAALRGAKAGTGSE